MSDLKQISTNTSTPAGKQPPTPVAANRQTSAHPAYVRPRKPHITQDAIDDLSQDDGFNGNRSYTHDSNITVSGATPFAGRSYRRSRADIGKLKQDSHYAQYLQIPKGKRSIFVSREQARRRNSIIAMALIVLALLAVIAFAIKLIVSSVH